jgi:hypothetical protein
MSNMTIDASDKPQTFAKKKGESGFFTQIGGFSCV